MHLVRTKAFLGGAAIILAACADRAGPIPEMPTWAASVEPILRERCSSCHRPGGPAPFPLLSYDDARDRAAPIAAAARERRMPPWLPGPGDFAFAGERRLDEREIRILERWAETGALPGTAAPSTSTEAAGGPAAGPPRQNGEWQLGQPDLVLEMPQAWVLAASDTHMAGTDVFRNFVIPVPLETTRFVRAVEFQPGAATVVHHLVMAVDTTAASRQEDARDAEPGFDGMFSRGGARAPGGFFVGWTPGQTPRANPRGLAWALEPGSDLVLQMHLRPHDRPVPLQARVGLHFTEARPDRIPLLIRLGAQTIDIPAGQPDYAVTDSFRVPVDIEMFGVYPHAHYLGRTMDVHAILPTGRARRILRIDDWDFNWQDAYAFERPVRLPAGTTIHLRYVYDNSADNPRNPGRPPRRVVYGPASTDEMAELWIQATAGSETDQAALQLELARKSARDRVEGWQHLVRLNPLDASAHASLGAFHQSQGDLERAGYHYGQATAAEPDYAPAHYNLGIVLEAQGDREGARRHYGEALRTRPDHAGTHNNLGNVLVALGRTDDAARHFARAIELAPDQPEPHANFARLLWQQGRMGPALEHYRRAVTVRPDAPAARFDLVLALASLGRADEALAQFDSAVRRAPRAVEPRLALAWVWATHAEAAVRQPARALAIAEQAAGLLEAPDPLALDVLAAAHAALGNFADAARLARQAHDLTRAGEPATAARIRARLQLYLEGRPYLQPSR